MPPITSREYKVMLDHRMFTVRRDGLRELRRDLKRVAGRLKIPVGGKFDKIARQTIRFLDTPDATVFRNRLILRYRQQAEEAEQGEFTLKCRTEDRYLAAGRHLEPASGLNGKAKLEEDIAAPFCSRFSHSMSLAGPPDLVPDNIVGAARLFPILGQLPRDGGLCEPSTPLVVVGNLVPHECVHKGLKLLLARNTVASVAVILWASSWKRRINCAELSFRYQSADEDYSVEVAERAYDAFAAFQNLEWCLPGARTKTQFAYGES